MTCGERDRARGVEGLGLDGVDEFHSTTTIVGKCCDERLGFEAECKYYARHPRTLERGDDAFDDGNIADRQQWLGDAERQRS
jgi:hypothetical protein